MKKYRVSKKRKVSTNFLSNESNQLLLFRFNEEFQKHKSFYASAVAVLESKELSNPPLLDFSRPLYNIAIKSTTKFSINPSLNEAPNSLLSTLTSRLLDLSVVRTEVAGVCFDTLPNVLLPVHVFLLGNLEQEFIVDPPAVKTLLLVGYKQKYLFKRPVRALFHYRPRRVKGRYLLHFYHSIDQFLRISWQRYAAVVVNNNSDDDFSFFTKAKAKALVRSNFGTFRTLKTIIIKTN